MTVDLQSVVTAKLADCCPSLPEDLDPAFPLRELDLDSLALLETLYALEDHFDITVDSSELSTLESVSDLVAAVRKALPAN